MMKKIILLFTLCIFANIILAQTGDEFFKKKEYLKALAAYDKESKTNPAQYLPLAKCYVALMEFDKAIENLKLYKEKHKAASVELADKWLELLQRNDDEVRLVNLGGKINTSKDEYFPVVSSDGKRLYFTGRDRPTSMGGEDIWYSEKQTDGTWGEPTQFKQLNTTSHEDLLSISPDNTWAVLFGNYLGTFGGGDLFYSALTSGGWSTPCNLGGTINSGKWETQPCIGPDGKTLVFTSDRDEPNKKTSDLFVTFLTDTGGWTKPINLGSVINYNGSSQGGPVLASDNKTLYFYSNGHGGFGGYDIFMSKRLDNTWTNWSKPVNMGRYINSLEDDLYLTIPASGNKAYIVRTDAQDGYGSDDIYEFIMPLNMRPEKTVTVKGITFNETDSTTGIVIKYYDTENGIEVSRASSSVMDGKYSVSLPAYKKYKVVIDMKGFLYYEDILDLTKPELYQNKEPINQKLGDDLTTIKDIKTKLDDCGKRLQALIDSKSTQIAEEFDKYTKLVEEYKSLSSQLDIVVYKAKSRWLESEINPELNVNYHVTRIRIGAKFELKNIFFDFGKSTLKTESEKELDKLVDIMNRSEIIIELGGHTDNVGADDANMKLSQERVNSVKKYLEGKGVNENRIVAVGYGEAQPIASNDNEDGRKLNRRVEVKITEIKPREGSGGYEKNDVKNIDNSKFDILTALQRAAKKGGVPDGSFCSDKVTYIDNNYKPQKKENFNFNNNNFNPNFKFNNSNIEIGEFHLKHFAAHILSIGYKSSSMGLGAGASFINKERTEKYFNVFGPTDKTSWGLTFGSVATVAFAKPLCLVAGFDWHILKWDSAYKGQSEMVGTKSVITIPLGLRYLYKLKEGIVVVPDLIYNIPFYTSKDIKNAFGGKGGSLKIGANVRAKILEGGLFYNVGPFINYLGIRAGVTF